MNKQQTKKIVSLAQLGKVSILTLGSRGFNTEMRRPITYSGK